MTMNQWYETTMTERERETARLVRRKNACEIAGAVGVALLSIAILAMFLERAMTF